LIGAIMMGIGGDPYALSPGARQTDLELMRDSLRRMQASASPFHEREILLPETHDWR
jgi:hypothetical protein